MCSSASNSGRGFGGGLGTETVAEFGAEPEVVAEVVDQRAPFGRVDVLGARDDDAWIGMDLEHVGFDNEERSGDIGLDPGGTGLQLDGAFGDAWRPDRLRGFRSQTGSGELVRLETEGIAFCLPGPGCARSAAPGVPLPATGWARGD